MIMTALMALSLFSCDIDVERPNTGTITVVLEEIPDDIKAVSIWCNANSWKAAEVNGSSIYIVPVKDATASSNGRTATFTLRNYVLSETFQFQLTPMPALDTKLGDDWWSYAISGSSAYKNDKNNIVCKGMKGDTKLTLNSSSYSTWKADNFPSYGVNSNRWFNEDWTNCYSK